MPGLFRRNRRVSLGQIPISDLVRERMRLQAEGAKLLLRIDDAERQKSRAFQYLVKETANARKVALAQQINTLNTQVKIYQSQLRTANQSLGMVTVAEAVKKALNEWVQSPLLAQLQALPPEEIPDALRESLAHGEVQDEALRGLMEGIDVSLGAQRVSQDPGIEQILQAAERYQAIASESPEKAADLARLENNRRFGLEVDAEGEGQSPPSL